MESKKIHGNIKSDYNGRPKKWRRYLSYSKVDNFFLFLGRESSKLYVGTLYSFVDF
jgi:hypothetical protein